ncbi:hypothetical protein HYF16_003860 [Salmonella enterica]|nr:hypothetical protein [Salmonella enterica]
MMFRSYTVHNEKRKAMKNINVRLNRHLREYGTLIMTGLTLVLLAEVPPATAVSIPYTWQYTRIANTCTPTVSIDNVKYGGGSDPGKGTYTRATGPVFNDDNFRGEYDVEWATPLTWSDLQKGLAFTGQKLDTTKEVALSLECTDDIYDPTFQVTWPAGNVMISQNMNYIGSGGNSQSPAGFRVYKKFGNTNNLAVGSGSCSSDFSGSDSGSITMCNSGKPTISLVFLVTPSLKNNDVKKKDFKGGDDLTTTAPLIVKIEYN